MNEPFEVTPVWAIEASKGPAWLVETLWSEEGVGIVGGAPKSCKTFLALELALAVASGNPVLGAYPVCQRGPVLVFAAEDSPTAVRERIGGLCQARGVSLKGLAIQVILAPSMRLDTLEDQRRLSQTVARYRPRLLVLDPFVRLHRINENSAQEVSGVLAYLRTLQREQKVAILVVHHARKTTRTTQAGLSLRGSGDFYAWVDVHLHLARRRTGLELTVEHRNAKSPEPIQLELASENQAAPHLRLTARLPRKASDSFLQQRVLTELSRSLQPCTQEALRATLRVRLKRLSDALRELEAQGKVERSSRGWRLKTLPGETESGSAGERPDKG